MAIDPKSQFVTVRARAAFADEDETSFVQRRVAHAGLFGVCLSGAFVLFRLGTHIVQDDLHELHDPSFLIHLGALVPLGLLWLLCRDEPRSLRFLVTAELSLVGAAATLTIVMGFWMPFFVRPDLTVALVLSLILVARAIYVPSPATRTALLGAVLTVPYAVMVYWHLSSMSQHMIAEAYEAFEMANVDALRRVLMVWSLAWWAGIVATSVAASRVIFGLREQVREVTRLGQYHLDEKLGQGGMGVVYRAHHALLQRPTAVKLLPPDLVGANSLARFEREVKQTARLSHPNTVTIFDYGHTPDGVFYYAMELLDGVTLDNVIASTGRMPAGRVIHILRQAAGSLAEAHAMGLVHRDVKPENIMLCEQGGIPDTVKVLDFGLVKEVSRGEAKITSESIVMGTPQYMAPEAITAPDDVDARADLYALGAAAYLLLTGRDVFEAESIIALCSHHLQTTPTPPSKLVDAIAPDLEAVVLRCLEKDADDRPRDARELGAMLAACADADSWTEDDARSWWKRYGHELARPGGVSTTAPTMLADSDAS